MEAAEEAEVAELEAEVATADELELELEAASRKVQALTRGRAARKRVAEKRAAKQRALLPPPRAPTPPPMPPAVTWYYQALDAAELEESVELQLEVAADGNVVLTFWVLDDFDQAAALSNPNPNPKPHP